MLSLALLIAVYIGLFVSVGYFLFGIGQVYIINVVLGGHEEIMKRLVENSGLAEAELMERLPKVRGKAIFDIIFFGVAAILLLLSILLVL